MQWFRVDLTGPIDKERFLQELELNRIINGAPDTGVVFKGDTVEITVKSGEWNDESIRKTFQLLVHKVAPGVDVEWP